MDRFSRIPGVIALLSGVWSAVPAVATAAESPGAAASARPEPNASVAAAWWPAQRNVWTPIGWKDHLFRFNVVYNGTVVAQPHVFRSREATKPWADQGVQLTITPSVDGKPPQRPTTQPYQLCSLPDGGVGNQGWVDHPAPVLWTEWPLSQQGLAVREEIFAHLPGATEVKTGIDPLYAWIRLSVSHVDELKASDKITVFVHLAAPHISRSMPQERNLTVQPERANYPRLLKAEALSAGRLAGCRIVESNDRIRLIGVSAEADVFSLDEAAPGSATYYLRVTLPGRKGAHADLLLPMLPAPREEIEAELAVGFDEALQQCGAFWSTKPATAAVIDTPESWVNRAIVHSLRFGQIIAERNPGQGEYSFLSGSWQYDALWPTPTSMVSHMMFDPLGYHEVVEKHTELFRANQGTVKPPGDSYPLHPGYFSSPKTLTSVDWLCDHGAILYTAARHALLANDPAYLDRWLPAIVRGCEFIKDARAIAHHQGVPGVLPPAVSTDRRIPCQSGWNAGWNYKGLTEAVKLLKRLRHPRAEEFAAEAEAYRSRFDQALRAAIKTTPRWTDRQGVVHAVTPTSLSEGEDMFHCFYLDAGPLFLVWSGLLKADDPAMKSTAAFFREGPNTRLFDPRLAFNQRAVLIHEMSSAEPCYSWNVYHCWQLGDRHRYLEGMYSLLVGAISPQTFVGCETRHGISGTVFPSPLMIDLVRLAVVDDQIAENELHLLRLAPKAWLQTDYLTRFEKLATEFGTVTLRFSLADDGRRLEVEYQPKFHHPPKRVVLHAPPIAGLKTLVLNQRSVAVEPGAAVRVE